MNETRRETDYEKRKTQKFISKTYKVTIIMLLLGQIQLIIVMHVAALQDALGGHYYITLVQFFVSFISIQLYVFFFHNIERTSIWKRIIATAWTFEINTLSIMKPARRAPYSSLVLSWFLTFFFMCISILYGNMASKCKRGIFVNRHSAIRWSERIFVLTSFGIIVCSELKRASIEFPTVCVYTLLSNIFVVIFAGSIHRPNFFRLDAVGDYVLIGQLYYLNFYALFMGYVWTVTAGMEFMGINLNF